jgi:TonB family protein
VPPQPARRALVAPKQIPKEAPAEADPGAAQDGPTEAPPPVEAAPAAPVAAPVISATAPPPEPPKRPRPAAHAPIQMTEGVTPPEASPDNAQPAFPEEARAAGQEGLVVLKFVVTIEGGVEQIQVLKGEPPFTDAAIAAVKTWRFTKPAMLDGAPVPLFRIVRIPFKIR